VYETCGDLELDVCELTIDGRFHGLGGASSLGVASLVTGWSHKCRMLFKDYDFEDRVIDLESNKIRNLCKIDISR